MPSKPKNPDEVYKTMLDYSNTKRFNLTESELHFMAENCYLTFESKGWKGISYWPPIAMRWVLTNKPKFSSNKPIPTKSEHKGKSVRDRILEQNRD